MRLCLAGLNSLRNKTYELLPEIPFILESFYYIRDYQIPLIKSAELFLLDSGAFTFMSNSKKAVDWDEYVDRYIEFINTHGVKYFFELDIDVVVGYEEVKRLRARLEKGTGRKSIPVWHKSRGIDEFKRLVNDYDYIAIGGFVIKEITKQEYPQIKQLVRYAKLKGCKVHGLGFTGADVHEYGFYSCDSTSWNAISRFGTVYHFTGKKIANITPKTKRVNKQQYVDGEVHNLREWIKYQNYLRQF